MYMTNRILTDGKTNQLNTDVSCVLIFSYVLQNNLVMYLSVIRR